MRMILLLGWLAFVLYALAAAPGERGGADIVMKELFTLQTREPTLLMLFALLGLYPMAYACLLLRRDTAGIPAWPFVIGSFAFGAFALVPYFWLRLQFPLPRGNRTPARIRRVLESRVTYTVLLLLAAVLFAYGLIAGDWRTYGEAFRASQFVSVMTVNFAVLTLLAVWAINEDRKREEQPAAMALLGFIPFIGLLIYLYGTHAGVRSGAYTKPLRQKR
ncbi:hypothetical protein [Paenibacillus mendelii]|uniref:DUF2834 domain-containing protein n=1 Tax=Paenibacillus mendelii TaxID=206163 RepID=A0ABV6J6F7_9BACL|nr:hypothetical protein [Paenibacillus mendelii]MCQ6561162.1 hypothetical protein [Paenibacillus mendelii]